MAPKAAPIAKTWIIPALTRSPRLVGSARGAKRCESSASAAKAAIAPTTKSRMSKVVGGPWLWEMMLWLERTVSV